MTTAPASKPRPLSPHLGIYKRQISSVMSILHRATGIGLAFGLLILVVWLVFLVGGPESYFFFTTHLPGTLGLIGIFGACVLVFWCALSCVIVRGDRSSALVKGILQFVSFAAAVGIVLLAGYFITAKFPDISNRILFYTGQAMLVGLTAAFFYHFWCGIRHLMWDAGWFLSIKGMHITGWFTLLIATASTAVVWLKIWGYVQW